MNLLKISFVLTMISLSGCGGGSSNSSGTTPPPLPVVVETTVRYVGTQFLRFIAVGLNLPATTDEARFVMEVTGNRVTILDADFTINTTLVGNGFTATSPELNIPVDATTTCVGTITYVGNVGPNITNGRLNGEFDCGTITLGVTGRFEAFPGAAKQLNSTLFDSVRTAL